MTQQVHVTMHVYVVTFVRKGILDSVDVYARVEEAEKKYNELLEKTGQANDPLQKMFANIRSLQPGFRCISAAGEDWVTVWLRPLQFQEVK